MRHTCPRAGARVASVTLGLVAPMLLLLPHPAATQQQDQAGQRDKPTVNRISNYHHLKVLEPFLGRWVYEGPVKRAIPGVVEKGADTRVEMNYRWAVNKNAIVLTITISRNGTEQFQILEMIGWDVRRKRIVSGAFNSQGGMSYAQWSVEGDRLVVNTRDVSGEGKESSATIVHQLKDENMMAWSETKRVSDGEKLADSPTYIFRRIDQE